jgi:hypothetical protein
MRTLEKRELAIALRARVTWIVVALAALLVGHGFVLALDIYAAASRSVASGALMQRELDPLAGIVRPTLGGARLAVALFVPVLAARILAVEKERGSFGVLALRAGSPLRVVNAKAVAASVVALLLVAPVLSIFALFVGLGGHLDAIETAIAVLGHLLHALFAAAVALAAASWTRTVAQATTLAIVVSVGSWAIEAGEGFAALAWMGPFEAMSVTRVLAPFEEGIVSVAAIAWLVVAIVIALALAWIGSSFDLSRRRRAGFGSFSVALGVVLLAFASRVGAAYDWTEYRRASLPPAAVADLRSIKEPIAIEVWLDREDSRRRQLERDALAKIRLARTDVHIAMPLDDLAASGAPVHDEAYGRIVIRVADRTGETRSASRREIVTRIFEIAGRPAPDWSQAQYPGYPLALDATKLRIAHVFAYLVLPAIVVALGMTITRRRRALG